MELPLFKLFPRLQEEAEGLGVPLNDHQITQFRIYLEELRKWNKVVRLVSRDDPESIIWVHFLDSLSAYPFLVMVNSLLDIGAGAGFPGIPLKIALPNLQLHLMESRRRKAHFLRHVIRRLDLGNAFVHQQRLVAGLRLGSFQSIISRALASPQSWLPLALDFLEEGGQIVLMLGRTPDMDDLKRLFDRLGLRLHSHRVLELPVIKHRRHLMSLKRGGCFT